MYAMTETGYRAISSAADAVPGETVVDEIPASFFLPRFDQIVQKAIDGVQAWIDRTAQQNGYDGAVSCASYAASSVTRWRQDAAALIAWRDAVWQAAHAWRASLNGQLPSPIPTIDQIIATLPKARDYGWTVHSEGAGSETGEQS